MDTNGKPLRLDPALLDRVEALAVKTKMSREEVINAALAGYLDWQEDFIRQVHDGLAAAERGDLATADEAERVFSKYRPA